VVYGPDAGFRSRHGALAMVPSSIVELIVPEAVPANSAVIATTAAASSTLHQILPGAR
jgi:hypothetical protein